MMCYPHWKVLIGLVCLLVGPVSLASAQTSASTDIIVRLADGAADLRSSLEQPSTKRATSDPLFQGVQQVRPVVRASSSAKRGAASTPLRAYRLRVRDSSDTRRLLRRWRARPDVRYAHRNATYEVHGRGGHSAPSDPPLSNNPYADSLNHLRVIRAVEAWAVSQGTTDVTVGVVDTGIYLDHPDLAGQFAVNPAEDNGNGVLDEGDFNGVDDDGNGYVDDVVGYDFVDRTAPILSGEFEDRDPDPSPDPTRGGSGHGTSVAGVIAATPGTPNDGVAGVAPNVQLLPLRAFGGDGIGASDDIAAAIVYAAERGVDVLNLSFGRSQPVPLIRDAIQYATDRGTIVVASAGNELTDDPHYPSDYPSVLSVVWLAEDGEGLPDFNRSQFGIGVDLGAPGSNVFTTQFPAQAVEAGTSPEQEDLYHSTTGSSFSAPQVAGAAALLRSVDSTLSPASIRSILTATAEDLAEENWDHTTGAGLLNVEEALSRAYPARTAIAHPSHNAGVGAQDTVAVVGTAIDPSFESYSVSYAEGTTNLDDRPDPWVPLTDPRSAQALRDTLARWPIAGLEEGEYTLRLVTTLRDGRTIEDRRRIIIDRTAPSLSVAFLGFGRVEGENGIVGDLVTDDRTRLRTTVRLNGRTEVVESERVARRHALTWPDEEGGGGRADVRVVAENRSGRTTALDTTLQIPPNRTNAAFLRRTSTDVPRGVLLPAAPDFDDDGLRELVLNQSREGGISDTLRSFEWMGSGFAPADTLIASFAPRDVGDTDRDGREELLLQIRGGTLLLEQDGPSGLPDALVYADTIGPETSLDEVLNGIRLTDLDADGQGELLGSTGPQFKLLERAGGSDTSLEPAATLANPTGLAGRDSALANAFDTPNAQPGDFDGDGRRDLLAGDRDGDLIVYEATGDDALEPVWTDETDRVDAGNRFAAGTFTGPGTTSFATMRTYFPRELENGTFEAPITYYSIWTSTGDNQYERIYRLPIAGPFVSRGAMTAADLDRDGRDELVIAHAPALYVVDRSDTGTWRVRAENREGAPLQTRRLVAADFNRSGRPSILAESADHTLVRFVVNEQASASAPPRWASARPDGAATTVLEWRAPGADSVGVLAGPPDGALDRVSTTSDSSLTVDGPQTRRYVLQAWRDGARSPLSPARTVRPHAPATVTSVEYPASNSVRLTFSEPLRRPLRPDQFRLAADGLSPRRLVQPDNARAVVLRFDAAVAGRSGELRWSPLADASGLAVGQTAVPITFPASGQGGLIVRQAEIRPKGRVQLEFSAPLDPARATDPSRYDVRPVGRVVAVEQPGTPSAQVTLRIEGVSIGPSGQETSLRLSGLQSTGGARLSEQSTTVRLTTPAGDLSNAYVYPNPYRARSHEQMTVAGLPREATVRIFTPDGRLVRVLSVEDNRTGGTTWDVRDRRGDPVPSGVYLFRINAPDDDPVLEKAAVIR